MCRRPSLQAKMEDSFNIHIWMISKLLGHSGADTVSFAHYIIAACYAKMLQRMKYRTFEALFKNLKNPQHFQFKQSHKSTPYETKYDQKFLLELKETKFGSKLLSCKLDANNFYNQHTCMAFHAVLCELLEGFKEALMALEALQDDTKTLPTPTSIMERLTPVAEIGTLLMLMFRGAAIKAHLKLIDGVLPNTAASPTQPEGDGENEEAEFLETHPAVMPKWQTYLDLLQIMVIYFDAIQTLAHCVRSQTIIAAGGSVDIKILFQPPQGKKEPMLTWVELLRHEQYFPATPSKPSTSDELITFLGPEPEPEPAPSKSGSMKTPQHDKSKKKGVLAAETVMGNLANLHEVPQKDLAGATDKIIDQVKKITNCRCTGSGSYIASILDELNSFKTTRALYSKQQIAEKVAEIRQMIKALRENAKLTEKLKSGTALHTGIGFKGACHAETLLALFLAFKLGDWAQSIVSRLFPYPFTSSDAVTVEASYRGI